MEEAGSTRSERTRTGGGEGSAASSDWTYTEKKFMVELTFALSLTGLLSHPGSNICKTQDQSHSDTTPLFTGHGENFQGEKPSI